MLCAPGISLQQCQRVHSSVFRHYAIAMKNWNVSQKSGSQLPSSHTLSHTHTCVPHGFILLFRNFSFAVVAFVLCRLPSLRKKYDRYCLPVLFRWLFAWAAILGSLFVVFISRVKLVWCARRTHLHINRFASKAIQFDDYLFLSLRYHVTILLVLVVLHVTQVLSQRLLLKTETELSLGWK